MDKDKICAFFGHREVSNMEQTKLAVENRVRDLIEKGYGIFCFGGFGEFDQLCWEVVSQLKKEKPYLRRIFYLWDERHTRPNKRPKSLKDEDYEEFIYLDLEFDWWYRRIYYRNLEIIKQSDCVVFYITHTQNSGAYKAYEYAKKIKKPVYNIANG